MYQLGLTSATLEVPRMSVTLGANRWASRVVVVLQLAAWTAVGIVLLQKGVSSLQKTAKAARNVTQFNETETVVANLMMKKILEDESSSRSSSMEDKWPEINTENENSEIKWMEVSKENFNRIDTNIESRLTANHLSGISKSRDEKKMIIWNSDKNLYEELTNDNNNNNNNNDNNNSGEEEEEEEEGDEDEDEDDEEEDEEEEEEHLTDVSTSSTPPIPIEKSTTTIPRVISGKVDKKSENISEARRNLRLSNGQAGGSAAAAVAMVAVGAVMLILGPAVIILRALDERRQERRFLKLSGQDDLPPSYEQATLMDEAPRYSTLSLNTIMGASSTVETLTAPSNQCDRDPSSVQEV